MRDMIGGLPMAAALAAGLVLPGQGMAQDVARESRDLGASVVTLYLHPFLTPEELATLRLVATNPDALALFVTSRRGHAAIAAAPAEGFLRAGQPVASAQALSDLPDAAAARGAAQARCDALRRSGPPCVTLLEVSPRRQ